MNQPELPNSVQPIYTARYKATVLGLLLATYTFNFIDRTIISIIGQAIKVDLKLSDTQLGLLGGLYFALLYTLLGIPIARLAERKNRVSIIAVSLFIWSGFTAFCGMASSFVQLAIFRFGVGIGEAGCSPPSHSLISDYFPPHQRARALSIYSFGIPLGVMFGSIAGGWLTQTFSWRVAFVVVGLPGILLAIIVKLFIKEPVRGGLETSQKFQKSEIPAFSLRGEFYELKGTFLMLFGKWPVLNIILGVTIGSFAAYGIGIFLPPYFLRSFALDLTSVGLIIGIIAGVGAGIGTLAGGFITDRIGKHNTAWYALVPAIGLTLATPIYILAYLQPNWQTAAILLFMGSVLHYTYLAPTFAVVQNSVPPQRRATATALLFFFINIFALGGGPVFVGWLIDLFANQSFASHPQSTGIFSSIISAFTNSPTDIFTTSCPGGVAPAGSDLTLTQLCASTLNNATRNGILVCVLLFGWAAVHFLLGSIGLKKHLQDQGV